MGGDPVTAGVGSRCLKIAPLLERRPDSKNSQPVWFFKRSNLRSSEAAVVTPRKNRSCMDRVARVIVRNEK
jgi:hypothetical protein